LFSFYKRQQQTGNLSSFNAVSTSNHSISTVTAPGFTQTPREALLISSQWLFWYLRQAFSAMELTDSQL
jgi:hypothetical protein